MAGYFIVLLFALAAAKFILLSFASLDYLIGHTLADDTFYYLQIARHAWENGTFPTFDGVNKTNGFHFLYQLLLIPLVPMFAENLRTTYVFIVLLNALFFLGGNVFLWQVLRRYFQPWAYVPILAYILLGNFPFKLVATGMEASLSFLIGMALLWLIFVRQSPAWIVGIVLGLMILARLDMGAFYALCFGIGMLVQIGRAPERVAPMRRLATVVVVSAAVVAPMVVFNLVTFGHVGTISSATKAYVTQRGRTGPDGEFSAGKALQQMQGAATRYATQIGGNVAGDVVAMPYVAITGDAPELDNAGEVLRELARRGILWALIVLVVAAAAWGLSRFLAKLPHEHVTPPPLWLLAFFLVVPVVHLIAVVLVLGNQAGTWYWFFFAMGLAVAVGLISNRRGILGDAARAGLVFFAVTGLLYEPLLLARSGAFSEEHREDSWYSGVVEVADYTHEHLPEDAVIGSYNAGFYGYISPQRVVNLDGLVNNWELLEARKAGRFREYVLAQGITHFSDSGRPWKYLNEMGFEDQWEMLFEAVRSDRFLVEVRPENGGAD